MKRRINWSVLFTALVALTLAQPRICDAESATRPETKNREIKKMKTIPPVFGEVFAKVSHWGGVPNADPCLPEQMRNFPYDESRGIFLNAPTKIITNGKYVFPLCGSYIFSQKFLNTIGNEYEELVIVVVNTKTHQSYSTNRINRNLDNVRPKLSGDPSKKYQGTDEELEQLTAGSSFAMDLYYYIPNLPKKPAKYLIYAILGDQKSNVVEVEVVDRE